MLSGQFQVLLNTIERGNISQFNDFIKYFEEMDFLDLRGLFDFSELKNN